MSEVIDAQVIDGQAVDAQPTVAQANVPDPFGDLLASHAKAEIIETKEEDLSPEDMATVNQFMSQIDIKNSQIFRKVLLRVSRQKTWVR